MSSPNSRQGANTTKVTSRAPETRKDFAIGFTVDEVLNRDLNVEAGRRKMAKSDLLREYARRCINADRARREGIKT